MRPRLCTKDAEPAVAPFTLSCSENGRSSQKRSQSLQILYNTAVEVMREGLIAPCGMNCGVCLGYLGMRHEINKKGFRRQYCLGCRPRGENCTFMARQCEKLGKGLVHFCYKCADFPCRRLKALDKRYRTKYHLSMIENLEFIRDHGIDEFLSKEAEKWRCAECGDVICCHNGLCLKCSLGRLLRNRKYRWGETR